MDPLAFWALVVGIATLMATVATLALVIVDRVEKRRRISDPRPDVTSLATVSGLPSASHRVWLENTGSGSAHILLTRPYGFKWDATSTRPPKVLREQEPAQLDVLTSDIDMAWMHIVWLSSEDRRWAHVEWVPLNPHGQMHEDRRDALATGRSRKSRLPRWLRRWLPRWLHDPHRGMRVGPGGLYARTLRVRTAGRRSGRFSAELERALRLYE